MARQPEGPKWDRWAKKYRVTIDGIRHWLGTDKAEAAVQFHALMANREKARAVKKSPVTFRAILDSFLRDSRRRVVPVTLETYVADGKQLAASLGGDLAASEVKPFHVTAWVAANPGWNPTTQRKKIGFAKQVTRWAKRQGHIGADPLADMDKPQALTRDAIMSDDQYRNLFDRFKKPSHRDFLVAMRETGARPSEIMRLEARHIDWDGRVARMESKTTRRTRRVREIFLTERAIGLFRGLAEKWPEGPILRNTQGRPWTRNAIARAIAYHRKNLGYGKEVVAEALRHGWITDALEAGVPIATVSALAGHVDTTMVSRVYSKLNERKDHLREALGKVRPADQAQTNS